MKKYETPFVQIVSFCPGESIMADESTDLSTSTDQGGGAFPFSYNGDTDREGR